jgi:hypothetical protein
MVIFYSYVKLPEGFPWEIYKKGCIIMLIILF